MRDTLLRSGIGRRTLLIVVVPLLLTTLALGVQITRLHMEDAHTALLERGSLLAKNLAALCEFGMYSEDIEDLQRHALAAIRESDTVLVEISNSNGDLLVRESNPVYAGQRNSTTLVFNAPVLRTGVTVSDFETDTGATGQVQTVGAVQVTMTTATMQETRNSILMTGTILTFAGLIISFILAYIVSRSIADPVVRLTRAVGELTGGNYRTRIPAGSPGELGTLEEDFNRLAGALGSARERLQQEVSDATRELQHTVSMLEARNIELDQARREAINAGTAKSEFLARMSHEIRTPLSAVIGFSSLMEKTPLDESQQEYIRTISQAAAQLLQIIDDILGYTRLDSNTLIIETVSFNLYEMMENVIGILSGLAHERKLELILHVHSDVPQAIHSDPNRIGQILTNLVNNAIKFTEHGHVLVDVSMGSMIGKQPTICFAVTDTGIGIDDAQQHDIFDPFIQSDVSISRRYGGAGLGLSISRKLATLLGGTITVRSQPGEGSTFTFSLPASVDETARPAHTQILAGKKIMIYDQNPFMLRALRNRFFNRGATVFNTSSRPRLREMLANGSRDTPACDLLVMGLAHEEIDAIPRQDWLLDVQDLTRAPILLLVGQEWQSTPEKSSVSPQIMAKPPRSERLLRFVSTLLDIPDTGSGEQQIRVHDAAENTATDLAGLQVLVAEDNPFNQQLFGKLLGSMGIEVTTAENGAQACELANNTRYDIIFMDVHMPVMGGREAAWKIRAGLNRNTPIIALTADVFAEQTPSAAMQLDDVLLKPVTGEKLADMIRTWCKPERSRSPAKPAVRRFTMPVDFNRRLQQELETRLQALRDAATQQRLEDFHAHLHQLKGIIGYFSLDELGDAHLALQAASRSGSQEALLDALDVLEAVSKTLQP